MTVALVDYGAGNLRSAENALRAAGAEKVAVTRDPEAVARADRVVLPGVGAFAACIGAIRAIPGLEDALADVALARARPFLGICVGMQILATTGHEFGTTPGLGWIAGDVRRMAPEGLRVPQIGWNRIEAGPGPVVGDGWGYFVHSYVFHPHAQADAVAHADYGGPITAAVARGSVLGLQFHPEKSQRYGLALLARFLAWKP